MSAASTMRRVRGAAVWWTGSVALLVGLATAGCSDPPPPQATPSDPVGGTQSARAVSTLPLKRGYYVASDTPCAQASNATLLLLRRNGIGGARDFCEFKRIQESGPGTFLVDESCADFQGSTAESRQLHYVVENDVRFVAKDRDGIVLDARYCAQSALPPDWRTTDIEADIK
jgi:hypothetical protein